jgi:hypothetical protein
MVEAASAVRTRLSTLGAPADEVSENHQLLLLEQSRSPADCARPGFQKRVLERPPELISGLRLVHTVVTIVFYKAASPTGIESPAADLN